MGELNHKIPFDDGRVIDLLHHIDALGEKQESRLGPVSELLGATVMFGSLTIPYRPGMTRRLGFVEGLQVLSGYFDERHIKRAAPALRYPYGLTHAYGIKIAQQLPKVIQQLRENPNSRRAIVHIGKPEDGYETEKPCIQSYQFQLRRDRLFTTVYARSWDAISGLPYDVMTVNMVAQIVASLLPRVFEYETTFHTASLHLYQDVWRSLLEREHPVKPPYTMFRVEEKFASYDHMREWAIDELNSMDSWDNGVPGGIYSR